jgi:outer membrane protein
MRTAAFTLLCVFYFNVYPQSNWTLQECIRYAQAHNIPLRQAGVNNEINRNNADQSRATMLPSLNAGASHVYNVGKTIDRFTNTFANTQVLSQSFFISGNVVLWNGFSQYNNMRAAELNYLSGVEQQKQREYDLALSVANAYINVIFTEEIFKLTKGQREISAEQLERTRKMVTAGAMAKSAEYEIAAQLANEDVNVITAENNLQLAVLSLRQLMNLDSVSNFSVRRPEIEVSEGQLLNNDIEGTYQVGLKTQPSIRSSDYAVRSAEKALAASRGRIFPTLSVNGTMGTGTSGLAREVVGIRFNGYQIAGITSRGDSVYTPTTEIVTRQTPFADQFRDNVNKSLGFTLTIPLFNGLQNHTAVKNAQLGAFNARLTQDLQKQNLYKNIAQAYADARAALNRYNANKLSVQAAAEAFRYAQEKLNAGASNAFDFSNAKNRLFTAEGNLQQAKYDYLFKLKVLDFYQGKPLEL